MAAAVVVTQAHIATAQATIDRNNITIEKIQQEIEDCKQQTQTELIENLQKQLDECKSRPPETITEMVTIIEKSIELKPLVHEHKHLVMDLTKILSQFRKYNLKKIGSNNARGTYNENKKNKDDTIRNTITYTSKYLKNIYDGKLMITINNTYKVPFTWKDKEYYQKISTDTGTYLYLCEYIHQKGCKEKHINNNYYATILAKNNQCRILSDSSIKSTTPTNTDCIFNVYMIEPEGDIIRKRTLKHTDYIHLKDPYTVSFKNV